METVLTIWGEPLEHVVRDYLTQQPYQIFPSPMYNLKDDKSLDRAVEWTVDLVRALFQHAEEINPT